MIPARDGGRSCRLGGISDLTGVFCTIDKDEGGVKGIDLLGAAKDSSGKL